MEKEAAIDRVRRMERYFDCLQAAVKGGRTLENTELREMLRELVGYYENGQWMADYRLDEEGGLPPELKRGVLSQDGLYDLLCELSESGG